MKTRNQIGRWESACLNLNTARNDWLEAVHHALDGNRKECLLNIDLCLTQLKSARWKIANGKPPAASKPK